MSKRCSKYIDADLCINNRIDQHAAWNEAQVLPLIDRVIGFFGVDRVLFGEDWPVLELVASYWEWVDVLDRATQHLSYTDRQKIFRNNAGNT